MFSNELLRSVMNVYLKAFHVERKYLICGKIMFCLFLSLLSNSNRLNPKSCQLLPFLRRSFRPNSESMQYIGSESFFYFCVLFHVFYVPVCDIEIRKYLYIAAATGGVL